jgi:hypothetical protein
MITNRTIDELLTLANQEPTSSAGRLANETPGEATNGRLACRLRLH